MQGHGLLISIAIWPKNRTEFWRCEGNIRKFFGLTGAVCKAGWRFQVRPGRSYLLQTSLHVGIGGLDQVGESRGVDFAVGSEFDMPHELAGAFEETARIGQIGTVEEADVDVSGEGVDVGEGSVADARGGMAIVQ